MLSKGSSVSTSLYERLYKNSQIQCNEFRHVIYHHKQMPRIITQKLKKAQKSTELQPSFQAKRRISHVSS